MLDLLRNSPAVGLEALEILVLDEAREGAERQPERRISGDLGRSQQADRLLDLGFRAEVEEVVRMCPPERQTLLFSATQTKSVQDLARLNLSDPEYISIHADAVVPTPVKLQQAFVECPCSQKISVLWGFIKTHLKSKVLVFFSTCKQAR